METTEADLLKKTELINRLRDCRVLDPIPHAPTVIICSCDAVGHTDDATRMSDFTDGDNGEEGVKPLRASDGDSADGDVGLVENSACGGSNVGTVNPVRERFDGDSANPVRESFDGDGANPVRESFDGDSANPVRESFDGDSANPVRESFDGDSANPVRESFDGNGAEGSLGLIDILLGVENAQQRSKFLADVRDMMHVFGVSSLSNSSDDDDASVDCGFMDSLAAFVDFPFKVRQA
jgi:hypothetical protein